LGYATLISNSGSSNIAVGYYAGGGLTSTESYDIDIGNRGVAGESNTIRIGGSNQTATYIAGINTTSTNTLPVYADYDGHVYVLTSSARYKRDIQDMGNASSKLMKLRPVSFRYKKDQQGIRQYGLIAEEVEKIYPEMVSYREDGKAEGVRYDQLPAMLLNEMQKQVKQNQQQARRVGQLTAQVTLLNRRIDALKKKDAQIDALTERIDAVERQVRLARPEHLASAVP